MITQEIAHTLNELRDLKIACEKLISGKRRREEIRRARLLQGYVRAKNRRVSRPHNAKNLPARINQAQRDLRLAIKRTPDLRARAADHYERLFEDRGGLCLGDRITNIRAIGSAANGEAVVASTI